MVKQHVCFIEEEYHLRFRAVAHFRKHLVEFREHPQKEGGIHIRIQDQPAAVQNRDHALSVLCLQHVRNIQSRFSEEQIRALALQRYHCTGDRGDGCRSDVAVLGSELSGMLIRIVQHRLKILGVDQKHTVVICDLEDNGQDVCLQFIDPQHSGKKKRPHLGNRGAKRHPLLAVHIPEGNRILSVCVSIRCKIHGSDSCGHMFLINAFLRQRAQVTLDVRQKYRNARI